MSDVVKSLLTILGFFMYIVPVNRNFLSFIKLYVEYWVSISVTEAQTYTSRITGSMQVTAVFTSTQTYIIIECTH